MSGSVDLGESASAVSHSGKLRAMGTSGEKLHHLPVDASLENNQSSTAKRLHQNGSALEDRDKTPTARLASPPPAAESNTTLSTISRLENKYADILNKIARRKRQENGDEDAVAVTDISGSSTAASKLSAIKSRVEREDREKTLEADNASASVKSSFEANKKDDSVGSSGFSSGLSKSATVIHIPLGQKSDTITRVEKKFADKEEKVSKPTTNGSASDYKPKSDKYEANGDTASYSSRYKARNERDTSNRYKDTCELLESLKAPAKSNYNHYGHYDATAAAADPVSSYYKSRYDPDSYAIDKPSSSSSSSAAARRTKSYRTRKEASKERKNLPMKLSAVNMDIDSPPPATAAAASRPSAAGRAYKQYGAARKSLGTGLTGGYQRSQTQKLLYDFDDNDIYQPPTPRDNKRKEIQNVLRKYAQYDDEDLRRTSKNPYASNPMKSATSANLGYLSGTGSGGVGASASGSHLYSDRRDPIADHYGLGTGGSSYYPRSHYGYDYPGYGSSALSKTNPYSSSGLTSSALGSSAATPYALSKTQTSAALYNPSYLGSSAASSASQRSRKNLMSFVRDRVVGDRVTPPRRKFVGA